MVRVLCCERPVIDWGWKAGVDDTEGSPVLVIERIRCNTCGAVYTPNDLEGSRCPLINYDATTVVLRVKWEKKVH